MFESQLLIGGTFRGASGKATYDRKNPVNGNVASRTPAATLADADAAVAAAAAAFPAWAEMAPVERRKLLLKAADVMESHAQDFAARGVVETGGSGGWYHFNVGLAASMLREAASMTTQIGGEVIPSNVPGNIAMGIRQACGVVFGIAPWNAPVILGTRAVAMPLACGNTVVLKASESCPALHLLIGAVFNEAGFPPGVVNVISNAPADAPALVEHLIAHPAVRRINFTGSSAVGRIIARHAARHLKPVLLELGGKNPMVVLKDADLDEAIQAATFGSFFNQGQICMSTDRIIVDQAIADEFIEKLAAKAKSLKCCDPASGNSLFGAMVDPNAAQKVKHLIDDAVSKGAHLATGNYSIEGAIMQPAVVDKVTPAMSIYKEESFGPVVMVLRFADEEQAVALANDSEYGLSASVFSRDIARALGIAKRIESGICHINSSTVADEAQMPFGGVKSSGYGRFGGKAAIDEFTDLRWITIQTAHRHYPV
ncbi:MAG TPA: aldehyde dehydrogenase [Gallionella sp.]|nr:aldehyde dehydrogenase [Gallionella sp.]